MADLTFWKVLLPASVGALLVAALLAGTGNASPSAFQLVITDGFHTEQAQGFPLGFRHEGPFSASAPFCSSGYAEDLELQPPMELRQFTCFDGSGSITARKYIASADAQFTHETGIWTILEGTGRYATLRGKGRSVLDTLSGDPAKHVTTRYSETWTGVIDFDVTQPDVSISRASVRRLTRPSGTYSIQVVFSAQDGSDPKAVSYVMTVSGSGVYASRTGTTASGTVSVALRVRPAARARRLQLKLTASDPVGNETQVTRQLKLPT